MILKFKKQKGDFCGSRIGISRDTGKTREIMKSEETIISGGEELRLKLIKAVPEIENYYLMIERLLGISRKQINVLQIFIKIKKIATQLQSLGI